MRARTAPLRAAPRARPIVAAASLAIVALASLTACGRPVTGSGNVVSRQIPVTSFSKMQVSYAFTVRLSFGEPAAVTVRVDDNLVDDLDVGVSGDTLRIGLKGGLAVNRATLQADVTVPSLSAIEASGASTVTPDGPVTSSGFNLTLSGASTFDGTVSITEATVDLSGASHAAFSGSAKSITATVSGASQLEAGGLSIDALTIDLSGASHAEVNVTGTISASASGASNLTYAGSPTFTRKDVSGGSALTPS
jgi:hypothetical protein